MDKVLNLFTTFFKAVGDKAHAAVKTLNDWNGVEKLKEAINDTSEAVNNATEVAKNNGTKLDAINANVTAINTKATVTTAVVTTAGSWYIGSSIINWVWPSEEQKALKEKALHDKAVLKVFTTLNECLTDNKAKPKDNDGMPYICETSMNEYSRLAGFEALNRVKTAYTTK